MTDYTFRRFVDKWVTPTTIAALLGAISWGLSLTYNQIALGESDQQQNTRLDFLEKEIQAVHLLNQEQTLMLSQVAERLERMHRADLEHFKEAEVWKRKIESNTIWLQNGFSNE